jgi:starch synthase
MNKRLRILFVSPEVAPLAAITTGLGESVLSLARDAAALGACVSIVMPRYHVPSLAEQDLEPVLPEFHVPVGTEKIKAAVYRTRLDGIDVYLIDSAKYFLRDRIYGAEGTGYLDNDERFVFFGRAVIEFVLKAKLSVDVIRCHHWPSALVPMFLRTHYAAKAQFKNTATVLQAEDFRAQGEFPAESLAFTGLTWDYFTPEQLAQNGKFNFLKAGVVFADALTGKAWADKSRRSAEAGWSNILDRRAEAVVPEARGSLEIYENALKMKKGGPHGR